MSACYCGKKADKFCGRCHEVGYCSVECQTQDWPNHKPACNQAYNIMVSIESMFKKIKGNVLIYNAWYQAENRKIQIKINESAAEFAESDLHFLTISEIESENPDYLSTMCCNIVFNDRTIVKKIKLVLPANEIKNKHVKPSEEWTLVL